jgi:Helix-turn-helix domain
LDLTTEEVAKRLSEREAKSIPRDTVKHWCQQGRFPNARRIGSGRRGYWLIPQSDLDSFSLPPMGRPKES